MFSGCLHNSSLFLREWSTKNQLLTILQCQNLDSEHLFTPETAFLKNERTKQPVLLVKHELVFRVCVCVCVRLSLYLYIHMYFEILENLMKIIVVGEVFFC